MSEANPKTVTVSIELPEPPDGCEIEVVPRVPIDGEWYFSPTLRGWRQYSRIGHQDVYICCRRVHKFPANAVGTFYPNSSVWHFTDKTATGNNLGHWTADNCCFVPATVFADFVTPPERRPYMVKDGVEVKDGAK